MIVSDFVGSSFDVTVIVAVPSPIAVMLPFSSIVTTLSLLEVYVTSLLVALSGVTVTVILSVSPISSSISVLSDVISSTEI